MTGASHQGKSTVLPLGASGAGLDLVREVRDGFCEQVVVELSSAGCIRISKASGGLKEHSSYSTSTTRPCYYCLYLLLVTFESHTRHLIFAIM